MTPKSSLKRSSTTPKVPSKIDKLNILDIPAGMDLEIECCEHFQTIYKPTCHVLTESMYEKLLKKLNAVSEDLEMLKSEHMTYGQHKCLAELQGGMCAYAPEQSETYNILKVEIWSYHKEREVKVIWDIKTDIDQLLTPTLIMEPKTSMTLDKEIEESRTDDRSQSAVLPEAQNTPPKINIKEIMQKISLMKSSAQESASLKESRINGDSQSAVLPEAQNTPPRINIQEILQKMSLAKSSAQESASLKALVASLSRDLNSKHQQYWKLLNWNKSLEHFRSKVVVITDQLAENFERGSIEREGLAKKIADLEEELRQDPCKFFEENKALKEEIAICNNIIQFMSGKLGEQQTLYSHLEADCTRTKRQLEILTGEVEEGHVEKLVAANIANTEEYQHLLMSQEKDQETIARMKEMVLKRNDTIERMTNEKTEEMQKMQQLAEENANLKEVLKTISFWASCNPEYHCTNVVKVNGTPESNNEKDCNSGTSKTNSDDDCEMEQ